MFFQNDQDDQRHKRWEEVRPTINQRIRCA